MAKHERSNSQENVLKHPSPKRAKEIDNDSPYEELTDLMKNQKTDHAVKNVLHWFRSKDIRMEDNHALSAASDKAKEGKGYLITMFLFSPKDMDWHGTSPARVDFTLESLRLLQGQLQEKHIPLAFETAEERGEKVDKILDFAKQHDISHIYANMEYEIDELRRDIKLAKRAQDTSNLSFELFHDQTVMEPGVLTTGAGGPHKVFTPYHKAWCAEIKANPSLLDLFPSPAANDKSASQSFKSLFSSNPPSVPKSEQFPSKADQSRIRKLWPPGHAAAQKRLQHFLTHKVSSYAADRSVPSKDASSRLSPYLAAGVLSPREAVSAARTANTNNSPNFSEESSSSSPGVAAWVREIAFREFYRHTLTFTPHTALNLPHNLKFSHVVWEDDPSGWEKWCAGTTGVPFVDAGMRQLAAEAYMHNRLRMNVASYLRTNMLIDYRRGERFFAERLIDWDLANNTNGWEPSYTVFNPVAQAERLDKDGAYIRKWVPELKDVEGKAVFAPHERLSKAEFEKLGYPAPHVEFEKTKVRAVERYKKAIREADD